MVKRLFLYIFFMFVPVFLCAQDKLAELQYSADLDTLSMAQQDSMRIVSRYMNLLDSIVEVRKEMIENRPLAKLDAYSLFLVTPATVMNRVLQEQFYDSESRCTDNRVMRLKGINKSLATLYVNAPWLIGQTENQVRAGGELLGNLNERIHGEVYDNYMPSYHDLSPMLGEPIEIVTFKPNFWRFFGSTSLQFTQSYFSTNWYQGGDNNYSALALIELNANYDNKQMISWENKLEAQLGFQTTTSDEYHSFKPTNNLLRLTSKFGYKAYKTLFYSTQVIASTQIAELYEKNSKKMITSFLSPLNVNLSVGLDYKFESQHKAFTGSLYMAPLAYNLKYCKNDELIGRYGIEEGKNSLHDVGANVTLNYKWKIYKGISWAARIYWFTNYHYNVMEWENTFDFTINKYVSAKFFVYPRYDDSSEKYNDKEEGWGYFMMKEWLSLGLAYSF